MNPLLLLLLLAEKRLFLFLSLFFSCDMAHAMHAPNRNEEWMNESHLRLCKGLGPVGTSLLSSTKLPFWLAMALALPGLASMAIVPTAPAPEVGPLHGLLSLANPRRLTHDTRRAMDATMRTRAHRLLMTRREELMKKESREREREREKRSKKAITEAPRIFTVVKDGIPPNVIKWGFNSSQL